MYSKQILEFVFARDPEAVLLKHLAQAVAQARDQGCRESGLAWRPGAPLKLLLSGYFGAGNVGSDMRSGEIVRQVRFLLGAANVEFGALAVSEPLPASVYQGVASSVFQGYIPDFLRERVDAHHGVLACEGSMFKSTFSDVLSAIMSSSLGLAAAQSKLAVGFGAEIGKMNAGLQQFVSANTGDALILCRNQPSRQAAAVLGLRATDGADTAWTFQAGGLDAAARLLRQHGWNGADPVITVCPINPFWWPVRADPALAAELHRLGQHSELAYGSVFFHADSPAIGAKYQHYIDQLARGVRRIAAARGAFVLLVGMEKVDARACNDLRARLELTAPALLGCEHQVQDVIAVLRASSLLISSRFHALVGAMPAAVPSIGISMDERIGNLLGDAGQAGRVLAADTEALADRLVALADGLDCDAIARSSRATVAQALVSLGEMGQAFSAEVARLMPEFPLPARGPGWQAHLPPLPREIEALLA